MKFKIIIKAILCIFTIAMSLKASAQIVNIEDKRVIRVDTAGWFGNVDLGFNAVKNTKSVVTLKSSLRFEYFKDRHFFLALSNFNLVSVGKDKFINDGFQHFRYNYHVNNRVTWEAFTQGQYNEKIRILFRGLVGTGPRYELYQKEKQEAYLGAAYMFEYDKISDTTLVHKDHRMSVYVSCNFKLFSNVVVSNTTYYQPVLTALEDLRLNSATTLVLKFTDRLSFKTVFQLTYDARVPKETPDIPATIYSWTNSLRFVF
ncbi:MAG: DUF481 domain-containing protein [Bacteroidetes bacterium]|nr:DUF481 domain-containing protein [Bacteroidota bacterium]